MNTNKQSFNWLLDAALLLGFLAAFFFNLTGLDGHQWLGLGLGLLAATHLLRHWDWVRSVSARFFSRTQPRVLACYTLDAALLLGFFLIVTTGAAISSWLSLAAGVYAVWKNLHVYASVITLALLLLKIGLHGRWIIKTAARLLGAAQTPRAGVPALVPTSIDRRHFLTLMGVVGIGLAQRSALSNLSEADQTVKAAALAPETTTPANLSAAAAAAASSACVPQCGKRCAYPGRCRRYSDSSQNGRCDLGECA